MREFATKVDNIGDTLAAGGFNAYITEMENIIKSAGFTLDPEAGPDTNLNMLGQAIVTYSSASWSYADSGIANTYVLSRRASSTLKNISGYYDGQMILFEVGNTNTGASTVNVATLGAKNLFYKGAAVTAGMLVAGNTVIGFYDQANNRFNLVTVFVPATAPSFHVHRNTTNQTVPDSTTTIVGWITEEFDTNGDFASNVFTPTVAGKFLLSSTLDLSGLTTGTTATIYIYKNGALYKSFETIATTGGTAALSITAIGSANGTTDNFDIRVNAVAVASDFPLNGAVDKSYFSGSMVSGN